jgi:ribonuclease P protein component
MLLGKQKFDRGRRLISAQDFSHVFDEPVRSADQFFTLLAKLNKSDKPRLGLAISKKNTRRAVDRNKIKRLARESFRLNQSSLCNIDVVVMAKRNAASQPNDILFDCLNNHWKNLRHKFSKMNAS